MRLSALTSTLLPLWLAVAAAGQAPQALAEGAAALRERLPRSETLVIRDGALLWENEAASLPVTAIDDEGFARVAVDGGVIAVARSVFELDASAALREVPRLVARVRAAGVGFEGVRCLSKPLLGVHLRTDDWIAIGEGVMRLEQQAEGNADPRARTRAVRDAVDGMREALASTGMSATARQSVDAILQCLPLTDDAPAAAAMPVPPSFARRLVRHGWLAALPLAGAPAQALAQAVVEAAAPAVAKRYAGDGLEAAVLRDSFGGACLTLRTPARSGYACELPRPQFFDRPSGLTLVVALPGGADPLRDHERVVGAEAFAGDARVVAWSPLAGFSVDAERWRTQLPDTSRDEHVAHGLLPPHLLIVDPLGDVQRLITAHGAVVPPRGGGRDEAERFLDEAAVALPDAGHLDLIGEYMFVYAFDSPDPRLPQLIGSQSLSGEAHQDAYQTLATTTGGVCRGDCDDLAELYQAILAEQGKHGHLMALPRHCAMAWSERSSGGEWVTQVLQTGPPQEFRAGELSQSLVKAYQAFSGDAVVDPHQLGILLRFSGENVRTPYVLSYRIFGERDYSRTMVDVQRDWHYHTYRQGYEKMLSLVEKGDHDPANYRELSGLCQATGQFAESAAFLQQAIERTPEASSVLNLEVERLGDLLEAGQTEAARALATAIIDHRLPAAEEAIGGARAHLGNVIATVLTARGAHVDLATDALTRHVLPDASVKLRACYLFANSRQFSAEAWNAAPEWIEARQLLEDTASSIIGVLRAARPESVGTEPELADLAQFAETWLEAVAFARLAESDDALQKYALAGHYYRAVVGAERFGTLLAAAEPAAKARDHAARRGGLAQMLRDLPWVRTSVQYYSVALDELFDRDRDAVDAEEVDALAKGAVAAQAAAARLGIRGPQLDVPVEACQLAADLVNGREEQVRARFEQVRDVGDKILRDVAERTIGRVARFVAVPQFERVMTLWCDVVGVKQSLFAIAWAAALNHAPAQALAAAEIAARRFPDDTTFAAEREFMQRLLQGR
jgi:hypothetical protein